jgi:hypothetical protein
MNGIQLEKRMVASRTTSAWRMQITTNHYVTIDDRQPRSAIRCR